jgi:hypothetical protein
MRFVSLGVIRLAAQGLTPWDRPDGVGFFYTVHTVVEWIHL